MTWFVGEDKLELPVVTKIPLPQQNIQEVDEITFPACVVTRSRSRTEESKPVGAKVISDSPPHLTNARDDDTPVELNFKRRRLRTTCCWNR